MPTDQNPNEFLRNTCLVNPSGEIRTEPPQNIRGPKPGPKTGEQNQKKPALRGMGVARLERLRIEEERKNMVAAQGRGDTLAASPNATPSPDPGVVLQGFPSYGTGGPNMSFGGYTRGRFLYGGVGSSQIPPWGFVETSPHEPYSFPNPQLYNTNNYHYDTCFKKQRINEDQYVVGSNGGGFSNYKMVPHFLPPDQRSQGFFTIVEAPDIQLHLLLPLIRVLTRRLGSMEELRSGNPRNGAGDVKEYEFFPGNYGDKSVSSVATSVGDCSPNTPTIDLSLKL
ncbi:hypothetical protein Bca52824_070167 [Brassica carinata]|uniref:Uncharacterized protein n=1 Tax=Brassica carinata TaxID=52824 RepID=A0A8X7Q7G4_BRACI|nr:hypothetical protein Bca52824_070167 [Brassica carinata]